MLLLGTVVDSNEAERLATIFVGAGHRLELCRPPKTRFESDPAKIFANYFVFAVMHDSSSRNESSVYVGVEKATGKVIRLGTVDEFLFEPLDKQRSPENLRPVKNDQPSGMNTGFSGSSVDFDEAETLALAFAGPGHAVVACERLPEILKYSHTQIDLWADYFVFAVLDTRVMRIGGCDHVGVEKASGKVINLGYGGE